MPPKTPTLAGYFSGVRAPNNTPTAKPVSATAERAANAPVFTVDSRPLPGALSALLAAHPAPVPRQAWPIPGVLGMGCSPTDKTDPAEWLTANSVRVVVDVSSDSTARGDLATACRNANTLLMTLPIDSGHEMGPGDRAAVVRVCRALQACVAHMAAARDATEPCPGRMYLCDTRGGGVAALLAIIMICAQFRIDYDLARIYVTRCWREKTVQSNSMRMVKMFPEGESLCKAGRKITEQLRQVPIATSVVDTAPDEIFAQHGVLHMGRAMRAVCAAGADVLPAYRVPFDASLPYRVVVWLLRVVQAPVPPPAMRRKRPPSSRRRRWEDDWEEESDPEDEPRHRRRRRESDE